jgi:predicted DNA-binding transcriptional regulator AlpA
MTARTEDIAVLPHWPRGLSRAQAAAYVGLSPNSFDAQVAAGIFPQPVRMGSRVLYDRRALDRAFDRLSGAEFTSSDDASPSEPIDAGADPFLLGLQHDQGSHRPSGR